jgi:hypothetical protein
MPRDSRPFTPLDSHRHRKLPETRVGAETANKALTRRLTFSAPGSRTFAVTAVPAVQGLSVVIAGFRLVQCRVDEKLLIGQGPNDFVERLEGHRLHEVPIESRFRGSSPVIFPSPSGLRHQRHLLEALLFSSPRKVALVTHAARNRSPDCRCIRARNRAPVLIFALDGEARRDARRIAKRLNPSERE